MIGRDAPAVGGEAFRVVTDDVVLQAARRETWRDANVVTRSEFNRLFAADDRSPDFRPRLLYWAGPQRHVFVGPEFTLIREDLFGPGAGDDFERFLEPGAGIGQRNVVHLILARNAAGETG